MAFQPQVSDDTPLSCGEGLNDPCLTKIADFKSTSSIQTERQRNRERSSRAIQLLRTSMSSVEPVMRVSQRSILIREECTEDRSRKQCTQRKAFRLGLDVSAKLGERRTANHRAPSTSNRKAQRPSISSARVGFIIIPSLTSLDSKAQPAQVCYDPSKPTTLPCPLKLNSPLPFLILRTPSLPFVR